MPAPRRLGPSREPSLTTRDDRASERDLAEVLHVVAAALAATAVVGIASAPSLAPRPVGVSAAEFLWSAFTRLEGLWLVAPLYAVGVPLLLRPKGPRAVARRVGAGVALAHAVATGFSWGLLFLPAALALLVSASQTRSPAQRAQAALVQCDDETTTVDRRGR